MFEAKKPCPFCGGPASLQAHSCYSGEWSIRVACQICGARAKAFYTLEDPDDSEWKNDACQMAVMAWEMRSSARR